MLDRDYRPLLAHKGCGGCDTSAFTRPPVREPAPASASRWTPSVRPRRHPCPRAAWRGSSRTQNPKQAAPRAQDNRWCRPFACPDEAAQRENERQQNHRQQNSCNRNFEMLLYCTRCTTAVASRFTEVINGNQFKKQTSFTVQCLACWWFVWSLATRRTCVLQRRDTAILQLQTHVESRPFKFCPCVVALGVALLRLTRTSRPMAQT
jgi:hypothetical protein